jgi:hypothetical protein
MKDRLEDPSIDERILERILEKKVGIVWTGFIWLRIGASGGVF